jgi:C-terminal processing protease CtpA/Prc
MIAMVCMGCGLALPALADDRDGDETSEAIDRAMEQARGQVERAREQMQEAMTSLRTLSRDAKGHRWSWSVHGGTPRLGVLVRDEASADGRGVYVEAVTPGSPAEKGGIKAGDVLTAVDGHSLASGPDAGSARGRLVARLFESVQSAKPGEPITLDYRRGKETGKAKVVLAQGESHNSSWSWSFDGPEMPEPPEPPEPPRIFMSRHMSERWSDVDLAALNPDLGAYFGAQQGVLVLKVPPETRLPIRAGDVIVKIGDRQPTTPSQAVRILRSYAAGEVVKIDVLRKKEKQTLTFNVPEH